MVIISVNDGVTNSSFNNMIGGIINVNATGTASLSDNGFLFNNHGTINVLSGVFNMFGSDGVHDGVYNISSGAEMGGSADQFYGYRNYQRDHWNQ